jgi:CDP-glucose 4,6-dehydratase
MAERQFWEGKRVLVTGNTGFKGGWLSIWLDKLGAQVEGFSLDPPTSPSLFVAAKVGDRVPTTKGDIRDYAAVLRHFEQQQPEIVFHMAAQPLVRRSYSDPIETYSTNVMGTVHVLEAARKTKSVRVVVNVTSDKCYENREQPWGYRESDPMGGHDPYSSSKGCAELVSTAYRRSYFETAQSEHPIAMATVRAGNVIGGGDWAEDRLVPDCIRALVAGKPIIIRNPDAVRPWQHVMEPLAGYILVAERLRHAGATASSSYNFGPHDHDVQPVSFLVRSIVERWGEGRWEVQPDGRMHEARLLSLDSMLARRMLGWRPRLAIKEALEMTVDWYRAYLRSREMDTVTCNQIQAYDGLCQDATVANEATLPKTADA